MTIQPTNNNNNANLPLQNEDIKSIKTILQFIKWCPILTFSHGEDWGNGKETLFIPNIATDDKYTQIMESVLIIAARSKI
jgi:hypothetical protein